MVTIFMNTGNSKTSDPHRLLLNLTDKTDLRTKDKYIALSNLCIYYIWKILKSLIRAIKLKSQFQHGIRI